MSSGVVLHTPPAASPLSDLERTMLTKHLTSPPAGFVPTVLDASVIDEIIPVGVCRVQTQADTFECAHTFRPENPDRSTLVP